MFFARLTCFIYLAEGSLWTVTSDPSLSTLVGRKYPADRQVVLQHWSDHFEGFFSDQRTVQESSLVKIPQVDVKLELDGPPTREEIKKATMQLKVGKSPGIDGIPADLYQHGGDADLDKLQDLFTNCWEKGTLPEDLRDRVTVSLYKNEGNKSDWSF